MKLHAIAFKEGQALIGQCIEHDICTHAFTLEGLEERLQLTIEAEIDVARRNEKTIFDIPPAPQRFADMFERGEGIRLVMDFEEADLASVSG